MKMAVFRDFYRVLMRGFFASIVCVFATFCTTFSANADTCENGGTLTQYVLGMPSSQSGVNISTTGINTTSGGTEYVTFDYGNVYLSSMCGTFDNPDAGSGQYCWCHVVGYTPDGGSYETLSDMPYIVATSGGCVPADCSGTCIERLAGDGEFRNELYTTYQCTYDVTYHSNNGYDMSSINDYYTSCATAANANSIADSEHPVAGIPYNVLSDGSNALSGLFSNAGSAYNNGCLTFVGWIDSSLHYYAKSSNTSCGTINSYPASNLDLYAVCVPARYAVYYHKGNCDGSDFVDNGMARYAFNYTVKSIDDINTITVPSGATFAGWTDQSGNGPYQGGANYTVPCLSANGEIHFYGVCNQQPESNKKITYYKGPDYQEVVDVEVVHINEEHPLIGGPDPDAGYEFVGWMCNVDLATGEAGVNVGYPADYSFTMPDTDIDCTGVWQPIPCGSEDRQVEHFLGLEESGEFEEQIINTDGEPDSDNNNVIFGGGTITYESMCTDTAGVLYASGDPEGEGKYCWCRVTEYNDEPVDHDFVAPWAFAGYHTDCDAQCNKMCADAFAYEESMRRSMCTKYGCRYTVSYLFGNQCPSTFNVASQGVEAGTVYQLASVPTATGYTVSGWNCGNITVNNNRITMPSNNVTCTASCNCAPGYILQNGNCVLDTYQIEYLPGASNDQVTGMPSTNPITNLEAGHQYNFAAAPARTNYDFIGWDCSPSPTGVTPQENGYFAAADSFTMPAASITCTAQWKLNYDFRIVYALGTPANAYGSSGAPGSTHCNYNETCYLADAPSAETGWIFTGWSCSPSLTGTPQTNGYFAGGAPITYSGNNNIVLCTAHWGCDSGYILDNQQCVQGYIIEYASGASAYDGMSVSGLPAQDAFPAGASYQLSSTEPLADGYIFVGWTCSYNLPGNEGANLCGEGMCSAGAEIAQMPAANVTCTARWRKNNYTITYNCGNHGDFIVPGTYANEPHSKTVAYNGPYTIDSADSVCTPINTSNSSFNLNTNGTNIIAGGWKCKANGAASYLNSDSGDHWLYDADYTCTAQWINVYQIAYYSGNCGDPSYGDGWKRRDIRANDTAIFGQSYTVQLPSSSNLQPTGNLPLTHYIEGLENCVQFVGYYDGMGAENIDFPCGDSSCGSFYPNSYQGIEIDSNDGSLSLYMHCNWVTYPIIYHSCDGNSTDTSDVRAAYHYGVNVKSYADTGLTLPDGYTFNGWATTSGATTSDVGATYTMPDCRPDGTVVNLYAVCSQNTPDSYTLHYVVNPGGITYTNEPDLDDVSVQVGGGHSLTVVPTAVGYTCSNWVCTYQNDGSNVVLAQPSGSITMPSADVTCTSNCTSNTVYLHWDPNGGSVNQSALSPSCTYLDPTGIQLNATPIQNGYTFKGWVVTDYFPGLSAWNSSTNGVAYAYTGIGSSGHTGSVDNYHWFNDYYNNPESSTWAVFFHNNEHSNFIMGQSGCSTESGPAQYAVGSPNIDNTNSNSVYCWCRVTSYVYDLVEVTQQSYPWVYWNDQESNYNCKKFCAGSCALNVSNNPTFRVALYGQTE